MNVAVVRRGYHEQQVGRLVVHRLVVHALRHGHRRQGRSLHRFALGVGDSDSLANCGAAHCFSCQNAFLVFLPVGDLSALYLEVDQQVYRFGFAFGCCAEENALTA